MVQRLSGAVALCLLMTVGAAHALGLGTIKVDSGLNQRFSAVIPFTSLSPEEAANVRARVAENQDFARAGVERSAYLSSLSVEAITNGPNPRIEIRGREIAREPVLNLLIEVRTPGGPRVLREYTVLLDPPGTASRSSAEAAASASAPASEFFQTAEEATGRASAPVARVPAPAASDRPDRYTVRPGDTLWIAAQAVRPAGVGLDQVMLALFETNPDAFTNGDIHLLRKGATLKVPDVERMRALSNAAARSRIAELSSQGKAPGAESAAVAPVAAPEPALATPPVEPAAAASAPEEPAAAAPSADTASPASESGAPAAGAPADPATAAAPAAPAAAEEEEIVADTAAPAPAPAPSLLDGWINYLVPALIALILVLIGVAAWRNARERRAQREYEEASRNNDLPSPRPGATGSLGAKTATSARDELEALDRQLDDDATRIAPGLVSDDDATRMVTTSKIPAYTGPQAADRKMDEAELAVTSQFQANTKEINLGDNDPLSEADFHLAYGLYDEAALLLQQASARDPQRSELRSKLAEVYFAAGRSTEFEQTAATLKGQVSEDDWNKLAIMGRQIAPGSALFAGDVNTDGTMLDLAFDDDTTQIAPVKVDEGLEFNLEELELPTTPSAGSAASDRGSSLEFDLGEFDLSGSEKPKIPAAPGEVSLKDFDLGDNTRVGSGTLDISLDDVDPLVLDDPQADDGSLSAGDDAATKLDLARAYVEMGDAEMARSLLEEVQTLGNDDQKREAGELRARLLG